ncbi:hypothetical protein Molly5_165 [Maribacter phage Molly_5]|uniref:Uncharacterized protein n=1 Tax=Maribacter phage Molly_1 TaxID=2745685 RepID=A0A8E4UYA8_9CAUD|nr:hypothetical protein M1M29_gp165 [Maribacter phage Molly_1]QQO97661.1 hypothetical protein Molly2_165 [Maribacter phage Molly_2]QQO97861.1 hypothetical protein Molly3_165 [Maribacter phage Molly_3]QQO98061.1 hypothetical protein Molly4_165 [Maribacter phage Molly_4]QQO98261.1 hypothetical protein Molly5_165 [Maribacter phage Molly_5]QQO97461.1 hypothetical protein Molly1_165 [Maribacter phage Molly_1]
MGNKIKAFKVINHIIEVGTVELWDKDLVEIKDNVLHCKDVILNPDFEIKGGIVTCRDLKTNKVHGK